MRYGEIITAVIGRLRGGYGPGNSWLSWKQAYESSSVCRQHPSRSTLILVGTSENGLGKYVYP